MFVVAHTHNCYGVWGTPRSSKPPTMTPSAPIVEASESNKIERISLPWRKCSPNLPPELGLWAVLYLGVKVYTKNCL